jgi:maltose O-acetyltransferase
VILPGVAIGDNCIIGAGAIVTKSIPSGCVAVGNPAKVISNTEDYLNQNRKSMETAPIYSTYWKNKTKQEIEKMKIELDDGVIGYDI